ncbi:hypothetical protein [Ferrovibrio sp.]|uniref:hypothetical protein n=1 Tax=Ferrovibrio sp. TaxID=1917215 RepID=UPI00311EDBDD
MAKSEAARELQAARDFGDTQHRALLVALNYLRKAKMAEAVRHVEQVLTDPLKRDVWPL